MPKSQAFNISNMYFNAICENKILAKISEFTLFKHFYLRGLPLGSPTCTPNMETQC